MWGRSGSGTLPALASRYPRWHGAIHRSKTPYFCEFMGQLRFRVFNAQAYDTNIWQTAFVSGLE
ncbi:MAG: hypothetical protein ACK5TC_01575, partial [bacterium]